MKKKENEVGRSGRKTASKQNQLVGLLRRKSGAKTGHLMTKLGWQRYTVRAAISRLRTQGHTIEVKRGAGGPTYSMTEEPGTDAQAASSELA